MQISVILKESYFEKEKMNFREHSGPFLSSDGVLNLVGFMHVLAKKEGTALDFGYYCTSG